MGRSEDHTKTGLAEAIHFIDPESFGDIEVLRILPATLLVDIFTKLRPEPTEDIAIRESIRELVQEYELVMDTQFFSRHPTRKLNDS